MSKRKTISQRDARAFKRRVEELEAMERRRRSAYATEWPGGVHIGSFSTDSDRAVYSAVETSRRLGHAVVAVADGHHKFNLFAIPHPKVPV